MMAFDLLYADGEDLRYMPLTRKQRLRAILPPSINFAQHGKLLFDMVREHDLEAWSRNTSTILICPTRNGSRYEIATTRNGQDASSYSSVSAIPTRTCSSGTVALSQVRRPHELRRSANSGNG